MVLLFICKTILFAKTEQFAKLRYEGYKKLSENK